jgi:hypothetical protein
VLNIVLVTLVGEGLVPCVRNKREEVKIKKGEKEERKRRIKRRVRARNEEKICEEKIGGIFS